VARIRFEVASQAADVAGGGQRQVAVTCVAEIGLEASECVYAGDARRDIEAGRAAGMQTVGVTWGYILQEDPATGWGATHVIDHPSELLAVMLEDSALI
jgi:phosphoglycolate phosphatase-like HAD superfamily hydrolase